MKTLADWTTVGPYGHLSWLTIIFTAGVIATLALTAIEQRDAWRTYRAVQSGDGNDGMQVLATSTIIRGAARLLIQIAFLTIACSNIYISLWLDSSFLYWYRIIFVTSFLAVEALLCINVVNDIVARRKLEEFIADNGRRTSSGTEDSVEDWPSGP